jgi:D-glycero-D-manno-heptose 1,7-bisphosphate phosphatase
MKRAVFLDRDGVLNATVLRKGVSTPPANMNEFHILPGVPDACSRLKDAGFLLIVVTNQPDVSRGVTATECVQGINKEILSRLRVDDIRVCYHDDHDQCSCRKPEPGLLLQAALDWKIDVARSFMVGDRWKDIEAGKRAGCRTILVGKEVRLSGVPRPDHRAESLIEAVGWIVRQADIPGEIVNEIVS